MPPAARNEPSALEAVATAPSGKGLAAGDYLTKFWELDPDAKRGTFVVRTYQPNFLLPAHYSSRINKSPSSPTHPDGGTFPQYRKTEAELQLSLRAKVLEDVLLPNADVWFVVHAAVDLAVVERPGLGAVPQQRLPARGDVCGCRSPRRRATCGGGWRWRMLLAGIAHESNGYGLPLSRSWNYAYLGTTFTHDDIALRARYNQRLVEKGVDDNPHITDYIGNTELSAAWLPGETTMQLTATHVVQVARSAAR